MSKPLVSVIMPSYNHAPYVGSSIKSVLNQTFQDFEFLIEDDGSRDGTDEVISGFNDPRITFTPNKMNRGAGVVTKNLIDAAQGKYIALINSDDMWVPHKLQTQVDFLAENPEYSAVFSRVRYVDQLGNAVPKSSFQWGHVFDKENRSQAEWLRYFLFSGNCLCNPSVLIERAVFQNLGVYDNRLRQLPDFDMWVRFGKKYRFHISDQQLLEFRLMLGEANASGDTPRNGVRVINEYMLIANTFFDGVGRELFVEAFGDLLVNKAVPSDVHLDIEKVLVLFTDTPDLGRMFKIVGVQKLFALLASPEHRVVLINEYGIDDRRFHELMGEADAFRPLS